ncbi:MAG: ATP-binding protein [Defluviitaleaceae bacterium]|nr:ATP-binding protein [Defluviitaleaceae bacterium]
MNEFSLHILDIVQNSAKASAAHVVIKVNEDALNNIFSFSISDDGVGMSAERLEFVRARMESVRKPGPDASRSERDTRHGQKGFGLWLLRRYCDNCGGWLTLESMPGAGTRVSGALRYDSPNRLPMGDIEATLRLLRHMYPTLHVSYLYYD